MPRVCMPFSFWHNIAPQLVKLQEMAFRDPRRRRSKGGLSGLLKFGVGRVGQKREGTTMSIRTILLFALFSVLVSIAGYAQATGSIAGTVTDPSGAVVTNAKVTITGQATGFSQ